MTLTSQNIIDLIPRNKEGEPSTARFREIQRLVVKYNLTQNELQLLKKEIEIYEKREDGYERYGN